MAGPELPSTGGRGPLRRLFRNRSKRSGRTVLLVVSVAVLTAFGVMGVHQHQTSTGWGQSLPGASSPARSSARPDGSATPDRQTAAASPDHRGGNSGSSAAPTGRERAAQLQADARSGGPVADVSIPESGPRHYRRSHTGAKPKSKRGQMMTYDVHVERDLPYRTADVAGFIHRVLNDRRSWGGHGRWRLERVAPGQTADVHVYLVTPKTTDALCAPLDTEGRVSCFNQKRVVLNAKRWAHGAKSYGSHVVSYRRNLVNHEFGHALGHGHKKCPGQGEKAPIMMQQTKGLHGCRANPWPYP